MPKPRRGAPTAQPHDALVKWTFSQREHAIALLRAVLPPEVVAAVDWSTLRVEKDSFVDRALRSRYSDVVISVRMGEERVYFYTLIEHQRDVEPLMVFRILQYMTRLWERLVLEQPTAKTLPPILPLLIHHSATGWTAATAFQDVIAGEGPARAALERHIPRFEVRLIDLSEGRASKP
jgi:predicted transposase YdaD